MSTTLYMEPIRPTKGKSLDQQLKCALRRREDPVDLIFTTNDKGYLNGLLDGGVKEAAKILELLEKHQSVRVWEE